MFVDDRARGANHCSGLVARGLAVVDLQQQAFAQVARAYADRVQALQQSQSGGEFLGFDGEFGGQERTDVGQ